MEEKEKVSVICRFGMEHDQPKTPEEKFFHDIVMKVLAMTADGLESETLKLKDLHPSLMISILVTNIVMNLFFQSAHADDNKTRQRMLGSLLEEIVNMCMNSFDILLQKDKEVHH